MEPDQKSLEGLMFKHLTNIIIHLSLDYDYLLSINEEEQVKLLMLYLELIFHVNLN